MIDEEKQINNTADQQGDTSEVRAVSTSEATTETMNANDNSEVNAPVASATSVSESVTVNENATQSAADSQQNTVLDLSAQLESLKAQLEERNTQYMRIVADFDNFRKRTQKEKEELDQKVKRDTIMELLPVVDTFDRARSHLKPQTDAEMNIHKSYQGVYKQMVDILKRLGVSPMRPEGSEFDPNLHEAIMREPTDEHPEGTVLEELVRGYFIGDRVLRHAMVKVAAPPAEGPSTDDAADAAQ